MDNDKNDLRVKSTMFYEMIMKSYSENGSRNSHSFFFF